MGHKWIIDVLADLKSFAQQNELILLADKLEQATNVATAEIASMVEGAPYSVRGDESQNGSVSSEVGSGRSA
jgi:hypothetical protein